MTTPTLLILSFEYLGHGLAGLVLGGLFATLFGAFSVTGQVGVTRLAEKYPKAKARLDYWDSRWDRLRYALLLCSVLMQVTIVTVVILSLRPPPIRLTWNVAVLVAVTTLAFVFVFNMLPRALSRSYADRISVAFLPVAAVLARVLFPIAWPVASLGHLLHRVFHAGSDEEDRPTPEDEIRSVVDRASTEALEDEERQILQSVFEFGDTVTREIMTPRIELKSLEDVETVASAVDMVKEAPFSRFPLFHETMDDVRGIVHVKDLLRLLRDGKGDQPVLRAVKDAPFVPESMPINDLLTLLRSEKSQTAIVVDEYGGTAGLVTVEDVIEELVGEILDEYDQDEQPVHRLSDGSVIVDARLPVDQVNELLEISIPEDDEYDSAGGFVFHALGRIPRPGETVTGSDFEITIQTANARQLQTLRILKKAT
jgi:CBS domain containing-hemolysin-like protein